MKKSNLLHAPVSMDWKNSIEYRYSEIILTEFIRDLNRASALMKSTLFEITNEELCVASLINAFSGS